MTVGELLRNMQIMDHSSSARFQDGSGGEDEFVLHIFLNGHGSILDATVTGMRIAKGQASILAKGEKVKKNTPPALFEKICALCEKRGISISKLEQEVGLGNATIRGWTTVSPKAENLKKVADFFGVTTDELLKEETT